MFISGFGHLMIRSFVTASMNEMNHTRALDSKYSLEADSGKCDTKTWPQPIQKRRSIASTPRRIWAGTTHSLYSPISLAGFPYCETGDGSALVARYGSTFSTARWQRTLHTSHC